MSKFKVGDRVRWTSQANGGHVEKRGVVFCVVPAGKRIDKRFAKEELSRENINKVRWATDFISGLGRKHESYLVVVPGTGRSMPVVYWPRTTALRPDDD